MNGIRFVRPEFHLLIAFYAIHFAVWVPLASRLSARDSFSTCLLILTPLAICYGMPAIWLGIFCAFQKGNPLSQGGPSFLQIVHLCLIVFTFLCVVMRIAESLFVT
ncbi:MAG: hypothetical protein MUC83_13225 [Pirellula sp.]|jgi:hypothetical protein|nr:hypothetical protein [Pirellula sp.]